LTSVAAAARILACLIASSGIASACPPLQVRIAAQRAEAAARRIDQHPVNLAGQPLDVRVALVLDQRRLHVRQS
jgi:hypothetical protein